MSRSLNTNYDILLQGTIGDNRDVGICVYEVFLSSIFMLNTVSVLTRRCLGCNERWRSKRIGSEDTIWAYSEAIQIEKCYKHNVI